MNKIPAAMLLDPIVMTITPASSIFTVNKSDGTGYGLDCYSVTYIDGLEAAMHDAIQAFISSKYGTTPLINPTVPKNGDLRITGSKIFMYLSTGWQQIFPAVFY